MVISRAVDSIASCWAFLRSLNRAEAAVLRFLLSSSSVGSAAFRLEDVLSAGRVGTTRTLGVSIDALTIGLDKEADGATAG